ncbi:MAG: archaetidylserine decarboxylase [Gammaproteobacteria bacterium]
MAASSLGIADRLFVLVQYLLPHHLLTGIVYRLTRIRVRPIVNGTIRWFCWQFGVDVSEAERPVPDGYQHFNDFFTRRLKPGLRPQPELAEAIASPCDGVISQSGRLDGGRLLQVKGWHYDAAELLGGDKALAAPFADGVFLTVYLAPYDYHRVHMPVDGSLVRTAHVPGRLFSVNGTTAAGVPRLFTRNERLVCTFENEDGPLALVLVGALNVGTIGTVWQSEYRAGRRYPVRDDWREQPDRPVFRRGDEMGWFNMGSTVIVLLPRGAAELATGLVPGTKLRTGQVVGRRLPREA